MEESKFLELDPHKGYLLVVKRGTVDPSQIKLPKNGNYKKPIPVFVVDSLEDINLKEIIVTCSNCGERAAAKAVSIAGAKHLAN